MLLILFVTFLILIVLTVPIGFALGISASFWIWLTNNVPFIMLPQRMVGGIDSFPLLAIPFFIFAGKLMLTGGISKNIINVASVFVGRFQGGLAHINIVASMFFAGITGSATSDSSAIGSIIIPSMIDKGYDKDITVAVTATSSTIGILIPPSIPMVIYGIITNQSIGKLFIAGAIPGVLVGFILMFVSYILAKKRNYPREEKYSFKEGQRILLDGILPMFTIVIILGGIIFGIVTPTEAAVVVIVYTFILGFFVYKTTKIREIPKLIFETIKMNGMVMIMVATATVFSWIITSQQLPQIIGDYLLSTIGNKYLLLFLFNIILLIAGAFLDLTPAMLIFIPILAPIAEHIGIDLIHFGVIVVANLGIGLFTPPVGACLFVTCSIAKINMKDVFKGFLPYFVAMIISLMMITYIPSLSLWLPSLMK